MNLEKQSILIDNFESDSLIPLQSDDIKIKLVSFNSKQGLSLSEQNDLYQINDMEELAQGKFRKLLGLKNEKVLNFSQQNSICHAVSSSGTLYAWGQDTHNYGLLGLGDQRSVQEPYPVLKQDNIRFKYVTCGHKHAAAIDQGNRLYIWGSGHQGELGQFNGLQVSTTKQKYPQKIDQITEIMSVKYVTCVNSLTGIITQGGKLYFLGSFPNTSVNQSSIFNNNNNNVSKSFILDQSQSMCSYPLIKLHDNFNNYFYKKVQILENNCVALTSKGDIVVINNSFQCFKQRIIEDYIEDFIIHKQQIIFMSNSDIYIYSLQDIISQNTQSNHHLKFNIQHEHIKNLKFINTHNNNQQSQYIGLSFNCSTKYQQLIYSHVNIFNEHCVREFENNNPDFQFQVRPQYGQNMQNAQEQQSSEASILDFFYTKKNYNSNNNKQSNILGSLNQQTKDTQQISSIFENSINNIIESRKKIRSTTPITARPLISNNNTSNLLNIQQNDSLSKSKKPSSQLARARSNKSVFELWNNKENSKINKENFFSNYAKNKQTTTTNKSNLDRTRSTTFFKKFDVDTLFKENTINNNTNISISPLNNNTNISNYQKRGRENCKQQSIVIDQSKKFIERTFNKKQNLKDTSYISYNRSRISSQHHNNNNKNDLSIFTNNQTNLIKLTHNNSRDLSAYDNNHEDNNQSFQNIDISQNKSYIQQQQQQEQQQKLFQQQQQLQQQQQQQQVQIQQSQLQLQNFSQIFNNSQLNFLSPIQSATGTNSQNLMNLNSNNALNINPLTATQQKYKKDRKNSFLAKWDEISEQKLGDMSILQNNQNHNNNRNDISENQNLIELINFESCQPSRLPTAQQTAQQQSEQQSIVQEKLTQDEILNRQQQQNQTPNLNKSYLGNSSYIQKNDPQMSFIQSQMETQRKKLDPSEMFKDLNIENINEDDQQQQANKKKELEDILNIFNQKQESNQENQEENHREKQIQQLKSALNQVQGFRKNLFQGRSTSSQHNKKSSQYVEFESPNPTFIQQESQQQNQHQQQYEEQQQQQIQYPQYRNDESSLSMSLSNNNSQNIKLPSNNQLDEQQQQAQQQQEQEQEQDQQQFEQQYQQQQQEQQQNQPGYINIRQNARHDSNRFSFDISHQEIVPQEQEEKKPQNIEQQQPIKKQYKLNLVKKSNFEHITPIKKSPQQEFQEHQQQEYLRKNFSTFNDLIENHSIIQDSQQKPQQTDGNEASQQPQYSQSQEQYFENIQDQLKQEQYQQQQQQMQQQQQQLQQQQYSEQEDYLIEQQQEQYSVRQSHQDSNFQKNTFYSNSQQAKELEEEQNFQEQLENSNFTNNNIINQEQPVMNIQPDHIPEITDVQASKKPNLFSPYLDNSFENQQPGAVGRNSGKKSPQNRYLHQQQQDSLKSQEQEDEPISSITNTNNINNEISSSIVNQTGTQTQTIQYQQQEQQQQDMQNTSNILSQQMKNSIETQTLDNFLDKSQDISSISNNYSYSVPKRYQRSVSQISSISKYTVNKSSTLQRSVSQNILQREMTPIKSQQELQKEANSITENVLNKIFNKKNRSSMTSLLNNSIIQQQQNEKNNKREKAVQILALKFEKLMLKKLFSGYICLKQNYQELKKADQKKSLKKVQGIIEKQRLFSCFQNLAQNAEILKNQENENKLLRQSFNIYNKALHETQNQQFQLIVDSFRQSSQFSENLSLKPSFAAPTPIQEEKKDAVSQESKSPKLNLQCLENKEAFDEFTNSKKDILEYTDNILQNSARSRQDFEKKQQQNIKFDTESFSKAMNTTTTNNNSKNDINGPDSKRSLSRSLGSQPVGKKEKNQGKDEVREPVFYSNESFQQQTKQNTQNSQEGIENEKEKELIQKLFKQGTQESANIQDLQTASEISCNNSNLRDSSPLNINNNINKIPQNSDQKGPIQRQIIIKQQQDKLNKRILDTLQSNNPSSNASPIRKIVPSQKYYEGLQNQLKKSNEQNPLCDSGSDQIQQQQNQNKQIVLEEEIDKFEQKIDQNLLQIDTFQYQNQQLSQNQQSPIFANINNASSAKKQPQLESTRYQEDSPRPIEEIKQEQQQLSQQSQSQEGFQLNKRRGQVVNSSYGNNVIGNINNVDMSQQSIGSSNGSERRFVPKQFTGFERYKQTKQYLRMSQQQ